MSGQFFAQRLERPSALAELAPIEPRHPFCTEAYVAAMHKLGYQSWLLGMRVEGVLQDAAIALLKRRRISVTFEIPSLPAAAQEQDFWNGVYSLCRQLHVTDLVAGTFGSPKFELPPLHGEYSRTQRREYVITLQGDPPQSLSSNHKRNIKKARTAGVKIHRSRNAEDLPAHTRLIGQSMDRRLARGESVSIDVDASEYRAYLETGAGELFQAVHEGTVLSSIFLVRSAKSAYYQTAGTSPEGMNIGASHFAIHSICEELRREGVQVFNLGGASEGSSLARFKAGFGASEISLSACSCYVGSIWLKKLRSVVTLARTDRRELRKLLLGNTYCWVVYALPTTAPLPDITAPADAKFQPLSDQELNAIPVDHDDPEFRHRQLDRLHRFGASYAYGVYVGNELAHISWLIPADALNPGEPDILRLAKDEAEITACETLPSFRGKGLYSFAIQRIFQIARSTGIRQIYMKTRENNTASQSGILKAGLQQIGIVRVLTPPVMPHKNLVFRNLRKG